MKNPFVFPTEQAVDSVPYKKMIITGGLELRDHIAIEALNGILSNPEKNLTSVLIRKDSIAAACYEIADAFLEVRAVEEQ